MPISQNGVGTSIQKSTDGGVTWSCVRPPARPLPPSSLRLLPPPPPHLCRDDETAEPFALLLLDIAAHKGVGGKDNVAVIGALSLEYSVDGAVTFNSSLGPLGAGQCIRPVGLNGFAAVGSWGLIKENNGVTVSRDYGFTYGSTYNISVLRADTRYGAFPSDDAWYITAGDWPVSLRKGAPFLAVASTPLLTLLCPPPPTPPTTCLNTTGRGQRRQCVFV